MAWTASASQRRSFARSRVTRGSSAARLDWRALDGFRSGLLVVSRLPPIVLSTRAVSIILLSVAHIAIVCVLVSAMAGHSIDGRLALAAYGGLVIGLGLIVLPALRVADRGDRHRSERVIDRRHDGQGQRQTFGTQALAQVAMADSLPPAVGHLTARMGHDLRTPLNAVIGFSDIIQSELHGPVGHHRYLEYARHIEQSGRALLTAAEDAITVTALMAKPAQTALQRVNLGDALEQVRLTAADGAQHLPEGAWSIEVRGDHGALVQALTRVREVLTTRAPDGEGADLSIACAEAGGWVTLTLATAPGDAHHTPRGRCAMVSAPYPDTAEDMTVCLARALCELQDIGLRLIQTADGAWLAELTLESAGRQPSLFDAAG